MALYAFDGTWNADEKDPDQDTNVVRFKELYAGPNVEYKSGVGTRLGALGRAVGGIFGTGGRTRISEMYDELCRNWSEGDKIIDVVGFSRGAALAVHFANKIGKEGVRSADGNTESAGVRFLGLWDVVGSFGLSFDTIIDFQDLNLGWDIDEVADCVEHCYHAMALDERRETFAVTRLDPGHRLDNVDETWFRGVHSDVGGGNENVARSNIALNWMLDRARDCGLPIDEPKRRLEKYSRQDKRAPVSENTDVKRDPRRLVLPGDAIDPSVDCALPCGEAHTCAVVSKQRYNFSGVQLEAGGVYEFSFAATEKWEDGKIDCGPDGWTSDQLPWITEKIVDRFESKRREPEANWFELVGSLGDEDDELVRVLRSNPYTAAKNADLYLFANDLNWRYDNNKGSLSVTIKRVG